MTRQQPAEAAAGGFTRNDGSVAFYSRVQALLPSSGTVLDFGAGRGAAVETAGPYRTRLRDLRASTRRVIGVDVDPIVTENPTLDSAIVFDGQALPLPDDSVDVIVADMVFEHIEDPDAVAKEMDRVVRAGGWICARTPNRRGYVARAAQLVPNAHHVRVLRRLQPDRKAMDVFPTQYRMNTQQALRSLFPEPSFLHCSYGHFSDPAYFGGLGPVAKMVRFANRVTPERYAAMLMVFIQKRRAP